MQRTSKKAALPGSKKTEEAATTSAGKLAELIAQTPTGDSPADDDDIDMSSNLSGLRIILPCLERKRILLRKSYHILWRLISQALKGRCSPDMG